MYIDCSVLLQIRASVNVSLHLAVPSQNYHAGVVCSDTVADLSCPYEFQILQMFQIDKDVSQFIILLL